MLTTNIRSNSADNSKPPATPTVPNKMRPVQLLGSQEKDLLVRLPGDLDAMRKIKWWSEKLRLVHYRSSQALLDGKEQFTFLIQ